MTLIPKHWPTPTDLSHPSPVLNQTADALFAWAYVAGFAMWLPFFLAPPFGVSALSMTPVTETPPAEAPAQPVAPAQGIVVPLSRVPARRAT